LNTMVIYTYPTYIRAFQQTYPPGAVVYGPGTVITPGTTYRGAGTIISPSPMAGSVVVGPGTIMHPSYGSSVIVQPVMQPATVTVIQDGGSSNFARSTASSIIQGAVQGAAQGLINEMDKFAKSPSLDCFMFGCAVQLRSKKGGRMLCIDPAEKRLACNGDLGNDYFAHFLVVAKSNNKIILRNGQFEGCHISTNDGLPCSSATGTYFIVHETPDHYITLQHETTGEFLGVDSESHLLPTQFVQAYSDESKFEVNLVYSPYGHNYEPTH